MLSSVRLLWYISYSVVVGWCVSVWESASGGAAAHRLCNVREHLIADRINRTQPLIIRVYNRRSSKSQQCSTSVTRTCSVWNPHYFNSASLYSVFYCSNAAACGFNINFHSLRVLQSAPMNVQCFAIVGSNGFIISSAGANSANAFTTSFGLERLRF